MFCLLYITLLIPGYALESVLLYVILSANDMIICDTVLNLSKDFLWICGKTSCKILWNVADLLYNFLICCTFVDDSYSDLTKSISRSRG